jgi:hypothetical protein
MMGANNLVKYPDIRVEYCPHITQLLGRVLAALKRYAVAFDLRERLIDEVMVAVATRPGDPDRAALECFMVWVVIVLPMKEAG